MNKDKLCPFLKITITEDNKSIDKFQPCIKSECMMYNNGKCGLSNEEEFIHY